MSSCGRCAGKMDRRITLQTDSDTQNSYGEDVETWSTLATVWAEKLDPKVAEKFTGQEHAGFRMITWRIRHRTDIDNLGRVVYDGQNYDILGTIEVGRKQSLLLVTEAVIDRA